MYHIIVLKCPTCSRPAGPSPLTFYLPQIRPCKTNSLHVCVVDTRRAMLQHHSTYQTWGCRSGQRGRGSVPTGSCLAVPHQRWRFCWQTQTWSRPGVYWCVDAPLAQTHTHRCDGHDDRPQQVDAKWKVARLLCTLSSLFPLHPNWLWLAARAGRLWVWVCNPTLQHPFYLLPRQMLQREPCQARRARGWLGSARLPGAHAVGWRSSPHERPGGTPQAAQKQRA